MTDLEFMDHAEKLLLAVERSCDGIKETRDADLDSQRSGGMLTLVFPNRSQIVINLQKPLHEVWMAARSGGYHYRFDGHAWQDSKGAGEVFACLGRDATVQSGRPVDFAAKSAAQWRKRSRIRLLSADGGGARGTAAGATTPPASSPPLATPALW